MPARDPRVRSRISREAALTRHAFGDTKEATKAAYAGRMAKFERQVDPEGKLPPSERAVRAKRLLDAEMSLLARLSAALRRAS